MKVLFSLAGLDVILERVQADFPDELTPVHMFALVPKNLPTRAKTVQVNDAIISSNVDEISPVS